MYRNWELEDLVIERLLIFLAFALSPLVVADSSMCLCHVPFRFSDACDGLFSLHCILYSTNLPFQTQGLFLWFLYLIIFHCLIR